MVDKVKVFDKNGRASVRDIGSNEAADLAARRNKAAADRMPYTSGMDKIKTTCGLTDAEIKAIFG